MKKPWLIAGIVIFLLVIAGVAYYFLVYKKNNSTTVPDTTATKAPPAPLNTTQTQYADQGLSDSQTAANLLQQAFGF